MRSEKCLWAIVGAAATCIVMAICALAASASGPGEHWRAGMKAQGSSSGYEVHVVPVRASLFDNFGDRVGATLHEWAERHSGLEIQSFALTSSNGMSSVIVLAKPVGRGASNR